jgi:putative spermidine/putrescine transport system ATP-binding protein
MALGDRIVVMQQGGIAQIGTPREIYFEPKSRFVAEFIGAANLLDGEVRSGVLSLAGGALPVAAPDGPATLMLRPEAIRLVAPAAASWRGTVAATSFLGDRLRVTITGAAARPLTVDAPNGVALSPGEAVGLAADLDALRLVT